MRTQDMNTLPRPTCTDLTVLYYTANKIPEFFADNVRKHLLNTIGGLPLISISQKPLDFGKNICVGEIGVNVFNLYRQVLIGAKAAQTPFVALCEDDCLYTPLHFTCFRPPLNIFAYNHNRWSIFTWHKKPLFSKKLNRAVLSQGILPRELLIESLEERFSKITPGPEYERTFAEPGRYEKNLRVTLREKVAFESKRPNLIICHLDGIEPLGKRKAMGDERVDFLRDWGAPSYILYKYVGMEEWMRQAS